MLVTEIKYRRVKNLGNYESEEISLSAVPAEGEDLDAAINRVKAKVLESLGLATASAEKAVVAPGPILVDVAPVESKPVPRSNVKKAVSEPVKPVDTPVLVAEEAPKKEEEPKKEEDPKKEEPVAVVVAEEPKKEEPAKPARTRQSAPKTVPYDRSDVAHTKKFAIILSGLDAKWKEDNAKKEKAKTISMAVEKKPFLDAVKGTVVDSFMAEVGAMWSA